MTDELKGFEPVGTVDSHYVEYNGDYTYAIWADEDSPPKKGTKLYTADQLAQVVQQRDELLKSMKYLQEYRLWSNGHAKAIIDSAIAKVQP